MFLLRIYPAEQVDPGQLPEQGLFRQMLQRIARQHARHGNANLGEDVAGYQLVVAGQDLHRDAGFGHCPDRCACAGFRWIQEDCEAGKNQIGFVGNRGSLVGGIDQAAGDPQRAKSLLAEGVEGGLKDRSRRRVERLFLPIRVLVLA